MALEEPDPEGWMPLSLRPLNQRLLDEGRRQLAEGTAREAGETLREALSLWRGAPLADFRIAHRAPGRPSTRSRTPT